MLAWQKNKHAGSALLTALFIMTLVAIAATAMTLRLKVDITKMQLVTEAGELKNKAQLPTYLGLQWLLQPTLPKAKDSNNPAHIAHFSKLSGDSSWQVSGEIVDLQSRFNINNIDNKQNRKIFQKLLTNYGLNNNKAKEITELCHYWIQPHRLGRGNDPLQRQFIKQKPPYYPGYQPFISPSELRLIPGIDSKLANKLMHSVVALPNQTPININTAPPELIKALGDGLKENQVNRIIALRDSNFPSDKEALKQLLKEYNISPSQITENSKYFLVIATVKHQDNVLKQYTIVERNKSKNKKNIRLNIPFVSYHTL